MITGLNSNSEPLESAVASVTVGELVELVDVFASAGPSNGLELVLSEVVSGCGVSPL